MYPKHDTASFKVLKHFYDNGESTVDEVIEKIGYVTAQAKRSRMLSVLAHMEKRNYLIKNGNYYSLTSELKAYVADVIDVMNMVPKKDLVLPAYRNPFTPEMKKYDLFANKRGY